jgi:NADP-dependent 3-hydroxy acid dehydrogenase YdfG
VTSDVSARTFASGGLYTASKHAQRALVRALQMEVAADGVRVSEVRPGVVATDFAGGTPRPADDDALAPEDVAEAIAYALAQPARLRVDEILLHPHGQTPEF